jgi:hypothetical protein
MTDRPAPDRPPLTDRVRSATSYDPDASLTREEAAAEPGLPRARVTDTRGEPSEGYKVHPAARILVRGPWEMAMSVLIGLGVVMLMQPFFLWAYTWSFLVLLVGTIGFVVVSHFPEAPGPDDRDRDREGG